MLVDMCLDTGAGFFVGVVGAWQDDGSGWEVFTSLATGQRCYLGPLLREAVRARLEAARVALAHRLPAIDEMEPLCEEMSIDERPEAPHG